MLYLLGFKVGMERGPSPLLSNCQDVPASPRTSECLGIRQNTVSPFGQADVWGAGEGWGAARKVPSLLGAEDVLATGRSELLADADQALAGAQFFSFHLMETCPG